MRTGEFLTAEWRRLAMLNYEVDPAVLRRLAVASSRVLVGAYDEESFVCASCEPRPIAMKT